jgi:hypothetical protein
VSRGGNGLMPVVVAAPIFEVRNSRGWGGFIVEEIEEVGGWRRGRGAASVAGKWRAGMKEKVRHRRTWSQGGATQREEEELDGGSSVARRTKKEEGVTPSSYRVIGDRGSISMM